MKLVPWMGIGFLRGKATLGRTISGSAAYPLRLGSASQSDPFFRFSHPGGKMRCRSIICISTDFWEPVKVQLAEVHLAFPG
jgi:hypothetical protein